VWNNRLLPVLRTGVKQETTGRKLLEFLNRCGTTGCSALKSLILIGCFALKSLILIGCSVLKSKILKGCIKIYDFKAPAKAGLKSKILQPTNH